MRKTNQTQNGTKADTDWNQSTLKENAIRTPSKAPKQTQNLVSFPSVVNLYRVGTVSKVTVFLTKYSWDGLR